MESPAKIGGGDGNLGNIPGITGAHNEYTYLRETPVTAGCCWG